MHAPLPPTGYLRLRDVLALYPISKSTWWAGVKSGRYPPAHRLSARTTAWRIEDIRVLIQEGTWSGEQNYDPRGNCKDQQ